MSSSKLENGTRCSSLPLPTTLCVAPFRIILPAEIGRINQPLNNWDVSNVDYMNHMFDVVSSPSLAPASW